MSNELEKEFDDKMVEHLKVVNKGGLLQLQSFIEEVAYFKYDTASEIMGALHTRVEVLKGRCND